MKTGQAASVVVAPMLQPVTVAVVVLHEVVAVMPSVPRGQLIMISDAVLVEHGIVDVSIPVNPQQSVFRAVVVEQTSEEILFASVMVEQVTDPTENVCVSQVLEELGDSWGVGVGVFGGS